MSILQFWRNTFITIKQFFSIVKLFSLDCSLNSVIEEQYYLAKDANISLNESGNLPDFERQAYISLLLRDRKKEIEAMNSNNK